MVSGYYNYSSTTDCSCSSRSNIDEHSHVLDLRYFLDNNAALDVTEANVSDPTRYAGNFDSHIFSHYVLPAGNYYSEPFTLWGRDYTLNPFAIQYLLAVIPDSGLQAASPANTPPPFSLLVTPPKKYTPDGEHYTTNVANAGQGLFPSSGDALGLRLVFDNHLGLRASTLPDNLEVHYTFTDFWGNSVLTAPMTPQGIKYLSIKDASHNLVLPLSNAMGTGHNGTLQSYYYSDFTVPLPKDGSGNVLTGWFHVKAWLYQGDSNFSRKYVPAEDEAQFGVYDYRNTPSYLTNAFADAANPTLSDNVVNVAPHAMIGVRGDRLDSDALASLSASDFSQQVTLLNAFANPNTAASPDPMGVNYVGSLVYDIKHTPTDNIATQITGKVQRFITATPHPITAWSLDNDAMPSSDFSTYITKQLNNAILGIRTAGSNQTVIGGNAQDLDVHVVTSYRLSWYQAFLSNGGAANLDALGIHPYDADCSWEEYGIAEKIKYLQWMMGQYATAHQNGNINQPIKPIWITEAGWQRDWTDDTQRLNAAYLVRRYALSAALGIPHEHNIYFNQDNDSGNFALAGDVPYRTGIAMRILTEQTLGMNNVTDLLPVTQNPSNLSAPYYPNAKYVHAIAYTGASASNAVVVVWGNDFLDPKQNPRPVIATDAPSGDTTVALTFTTTASVTAYNIMGKQIDIGTSSPYTIPATGSPVYVHLSSLTGLSINGWPVLNGKTNWALQTNHGVAKAYYMDSYGTTTSKPEDTRDDDFVDGHTHEYLISGSAAAFNDGIWQYDYGNTSYLTDQQTIVRLIGSPGFRKLTFSRTPTPWKRQPMPLPRWISPTVPT